MSEVKENTVVKSECRRSHHLKAGFNNEDSLLMSIRDTMSNGEIKKYIKIVENYERPFYVTRKAKRNHKQKRSVVPIGDVQKFLCTDSALPKVVPKKLGFPYNTRDFWSAKDSPHLYGTDQSAEFLSKLEYNKDVEKDMYEYATTDIESDVMDRFEHKVLMQSVAMDKKVYLAVQDKFLGRIENPKDVLQKCIDDNLSEYIEEGLKIEFSITDPLSVMTTCFDKLHKWKPDIVGIWNINYDIPFIEKALDKLGSSMREVVSDPSLPNELKRYNYVEGPSEIFDKNNNSTRLAFHQRWHVTYSTSYFELIDAMCVFSELRSQDAKRPSYGLDAILKEFLDLRKLTFKHIEDAEQLQQFVEKDKKLTRLIGSLEEFRSKLYVKTDINYEVKHGLKGLEHHMMMQDKYPIEYCVYNIFDSYSMVLFEEAVQDMKIKLLIFMGDTPIRDLKRRAKRLSDTVHLYAAKHDMVAGSSYGRFPDIETLDLEGWIITANAYMRRDGGTRCLRTNTHHVTNIYCNSLDVDLTSSYPEIYRATRHSRSTTISTVSAIDGKHVTLKMRRHMVNVVHGSVNAMDVNHHLYNKPSAPDVLNRVKELLEAA